MANKKCPGGKIRSGGRGRGLGIGKGCGPIMSKERKEKLTQKVYRITTAWDGVRNYDNFDVIASSAMTAAAWLNAQILFNRRQKIQHETVDEITLISEIDYDTKL